MTVLCVLDSLTVQHCNNSTALRNIMDSLMPHHTCRPLLSYDMSSIKNQQNVSLDCIEDNWNIPHVFHNVLHVTQFAMLVLSPICRCFPIQRETWIIFHDFCFAIKVNCRLTGVFNWVIFFDAEDIMQKRWWTRCKEDMMKWQSIQIENCT